ncbi:hypothetical protein GCM10020219_079810 [Nonomuraea dietziae]
MDGDASPLRGEGPADRAADVGASAGDEHVLPGELGVDHALAPFWLDVYAGPHPGSGSGRLVDGYHRRGAPRRLAFVFASWG